MDLRPTFANDGLSDLEEDVDLPVLTAAIF